VRSIPRSSPKSNDAHREKIAFAVVRSSLFVCGLRKVFPPRSADCGNRCADRSAPFPGLSRHYATKPDGPRVRCAN